MRKHHSLLANFHLLPSKLTMTNYSSSNTALLPIFEEAEAFLTALAGQDAQFTFQTFDDVEVWDEAKQKAVKRMDKNLVRVLHGTLNEHKHALAALNKRGAGVFVAINKAAKSINCFIILYVCVQALYVFLPFLIALVIVS